MIYVHLSITIAVLALTLYLYSRASQNNPGAILKWIWYIAIAAAFSIMVCQLATGLGSMFGGNKDCHKGGSDCYRKGGHHGAMHHGSGHGCAMNTCKKGGKRCMKGHCDMSMKGHHKMMMMDCEGMEWEEEMNIDSTADGKKVIKKKIIISTDETTDDDDDDDEEDDD
jgi:hypothetical protein